MAAWYYVAKNGSNGNNGLSLSTPWLTWQYGMTQLYPGDTLFVRGNGGDYTAMYSSDEGVNLNPSSSRGRNGTSGVGNNITVMGYPGEAMPVLDCTFLTSSDEHNGMYIQNLSYWDFKRLEVKNCKNRGSGQPAPGITLTGCSNINLDWCVLHDNDNGFISYSGNEIRFINCDSYTNGVGSPYLGNNGFYARCSGSDTTYFEGCRAWGNGQDGYDCFAAPGTGGGYIYWNKCWAFSNSLTYQGVGFKTGTNRAPSVSSSPQRVLTNCLAANEPIGYDESQDEGLGYSVPVVIYNCVSFNNTAGWNFQWGNGLESSFYQDIIRNNISYLDGTVGYWGSVDNIIDHNSWNGYTVNSSDFVSVDDSQLLASRQANGDLPVISFMTLASGSDLIDSGTDVGLELDCFGNAWNNPTPSLGYAETGSAPPEKVYIESITVTGIGDATTIETDNGTLQMLADILPVDATNQNVSWSVIPGSGTATINSAGMLSALTNGMVIVRADALDGSGIYGTLEITITNQTTDIKVTSVTVRGAGDSGEITVSGGTLQMYADVLPVNATNQTVTWSVFSGTGSATIDQNGLLTAVSNGIVTVRATANDSI